MKTKKIGKRTIITFTYLEWVASGKVIPQPETGFEVDGITEWVIKEVPEDKEEFFKQLGWRVVLAINKGQGSRKFI